MKKYKVAFHCLCLLVLFSTTSLAGVLNLQFVDVFGNPIPSVTIAVSSRPNAIETGVDAYILMSDSNGRAAIQYNGPVSPSSCMVLPRSYFSIQKTGFKFHFDNASLFDGLVPCSSDPVTNRQIVGTTLPIFTSVSAADYLPRFTSDMISSSFGDGLATSIEVATLPLKTTLAGRRLVIKDSAGNEKTANLLFVSPTQINYITPSELSPGRAVVKLVDENGIVFKVGFITVLTVVPSIFTADASGRGVPAAATVRASSGYQVYDLVYRLDPASQRVVPAEIDLAGESEIVVLALFGTGWRQVDSVSNVLVKIGGIDCPVEYAGKQTTIEGLDQINVRLPRTLIGKGNVNVEVSIDGNQANLVQLRIK